MTAFNDRNRPREEPAKSPEIGSEAALYRHEFLSSLVKWCWRMETVLPSLADEISRLEASFRAAHARSVDEFLLARLVIPLTRYPPSDINEFHRSISVVEEIYTKFGHEDLALSVRQIRDSQ